MVKSSYNLDHLCVRRWNEPPKYPSPEGHWPDHVLLPNDRAFGVVVACAFTFSEFRDFFAAPRLVFIAAFLLLVLFAHLPRHLHGGSIDSLASPMRAVV